MRELLLLLPYIFASSLSFDGLYDELHNAISKAIEEAKQKVHARGVPDEEYYQSEWEANLRVFEGGINRGMMERAEDTHSVKYQIRNHTLYRQRTCTFPARCAGIEYFLHIVAKEIPDTEFVINDFDHPKAPTHEQPTPVFSFSKNEYFNDIQYPAWSFNQGGPAISVYPSGIGDWQKTSDIINQAADDIDWNDKIEKGFFLGSRTNEQRDELIRLSRREPHLVNARFTKNQAYKGPQLSTSWTGSRQPADRRLTGNEAIQDTLDEEPAPEKPFEENCQFKYLFNFRGVAASFRFRHLLLCDSVVFHVDDGWTEFFYPKLIPWYHYVPVYINSKEHIKRLLEYAKEHDDEMRSIARNGRTWVRSHLRMKDIVSYWKGLLLKYTSLLTFKVTSDTSLFLVPPPKK